MTAKAAPLPLLRRAFYPAAAVLLDVKPYLVNGWWRLGYSATNIVFCILPFVYAWGALSTRGAAR